MLTEPTHGGKRVTGTARERVIDAAVELFAEHGVQGTSLRMIADRLGVAKGAVYYQFRSKDDIVLALLTPLFDDISNIIENAEAQPSPQRRRQAAIHGLVDAAVDQRRASCLFRGDPAVGELVTRHGEWEALVDRMRSLLWGARPTHSERVAMSVACTGLYFCTTDPGLRDIPDQDLREILLRGFLACVSEPVPEPAASPPRPAATQPGAALRDSVPCR
ncbi:TetR/AcrR family transcriptional regulator [Mycolicibacterium sp. 22603]|uniref:TetR/AcrR family transcriptional regulator n=1 Tax=Mycolicibacterium sp. 22603 TaxID=3453950 RepID=UPI003F84F7BF